MATNPFRTLTACTTVSVRFRGSSRAGNRRKELREIIKRDRILISAFFIELKV